MLENNIKGNILNVTSVAGYEPVYGAYGASKIAATGLTRGWGKMFANDGITINGIAPGPVATEFAKVASKGARKEVHHGKDPLKVVRHCVRALKRKKHFAFYGLDWKFKAFICRFIGRYFGARMTYKYAKRPSN